MDRKKAFALRIDESLLREVQKLAKEQYRSVNGQIEWMLLQSLRDSNKWAGKVRRDEQGDESD